MKKLLLLLIIAVKINSIHAQDFDTIPPYQKDSLHIPKFTVLKTDSTFANESVIPKDKPVVIIYFSPECGHCQITADDPNYTIPSYYRVKLTPFMAIYNKEHHLIKTYQQGTDVDTLIKLLKEQ